MGALIGCAALGVISSGCAGFLVADGWFARRERRQRHQLAIQQGEGEAKTPSWLEWRLLHGVRLFMPLSQALLRKVMVRRYACWTQLALEEKGLASTIEGIVSLLMVAALVVIGAGWLIAGSPVFGIALAGAAVVGFCSAVKTQSERRAAALRDEIPDALRSLGVCFRAGLSLMQTLRQTAQEMKGPLGALFQSAALLLNAGGTASEALAVFRQRSDVPELAFVAVALDVQHRSGGSVAHVLDAARESVEGEIELATSLRVQTAQAKLSARIVTLMPFVLVALFSFMSPGFLDPFFGSLPGMLLLSAALLMQVAGVLLVRRMLDVEGR